MTKEEKIRKIFKDAQDQVMAVLFSDDRTMVEAVANIDATANKIMKDSFAAKTMLADENNIDKERYGMLDFIPDDAIPGLFESCKHWVENGKFEKDSLYLRFCEDMAKIQLTSVEEELNKNIDVIIFKYKQINGNSTGSIDGEAQA